MNFLLFDSIRWPTKTAKRHNNNLLIRACEYVLDKHKANSMARAHPCECHKNHLSSYYIFSTEWNFNIEMSTMWYIDMPNIGHVILFFHCAIREMSLFQWNHAKMTVSKLANFKRYDHFHDIILIIFKTKHFNRIMIFIVYL